MPPLPPPSSTRLVTIVAQVDHGKTTLADSLIESNGIISERMAGSIRYLDASEEEQRRGITMRASAIGLRHAYGGGNKKKMRDDESEDMVVHLVDSPGHVDFSAEVTSSLLSCDGALLVVDAVEGLCARTHMILREAYAHELVPILIVNKIDRLCLDLCLTPTEAYLRLRELVESVNAATAAMILSRVGSDHDTHNDNEQQHNNDDDDYNNVWDFDPARGNVLFASAYYNWGFTVQSLARSLFKNKILPVKPPMLKQLLFSDCKYNSDTKKMVKWKHNQQDSVDDNMPLFAEFALKPIWEIYEGVDTAAGAAGLSSGLFADARASSSTQNNSYNGPSKNNAAKITCDTQGMEQVVKAMSTGSTANNNTTNTTTASSLETLLRHFSSVESILRAVLRRYRPLSDSVLDAVCEQVPSPAVASSTIRKKTLALQQPPQQQHRHKDFDNIQQAVVSCSTDADAPTVAHVCTFLATTQSSVMGGSGSLVSNNGDDNNNTNESIIMGLARVLSGTLRSDDVEYHMYGPKHKGDSAPPKRSIKLYLLMGSSFVHVKSVPAGHICAVHDLEDLQLKTVTMCDVEGGMPLCGFGNRGLQPLVKVNIEPVVASDTGILERGLMKLSLADASVEVTATSRGERLLACLGEIHLEQSINDLEKVYCSSTDADGKLNTIALRISDPIVEFGESTSWFEGETADYQSFIVGAAKHPPLRQVQIPPHCEEEGLGSAHHGRCRTLLSGRGAAINLRVVPLSRCVFDCLEQKKLVDGSEEDLLEIGRALGLSMNTTSDANENTTASCLNPELVLAALTQSVCALDKNGNVLIESPGLFNGQSVKGVVSKEVYVPPARKLTQQGNNSRRDQENNDGTLENNEKHHSVDTGIKEKYEEVQTFIHGGNQHGNDTTREDQSSEDVSIDQSAVEVWRSEMRGSAVAGFQLALRAGPLCEEPVYGVLVALEGVEIAMQRTSPSSTNGTNGTVSTPLFCSAKSIVGGMVVAALRSGIRCALLTRPARLMEGHLKLTLHSSLAGLGPLYAVLSKRRGRVISDTMVEGTDLILITASLPQAESFRLSSELLEKSSGEVTAPELVFSNWSVLDEDPFWIPTSLEEREDYGEIVQNGDSSTGVDNNALRYIRATRKRKGLMVDSSKIVVAAEKQRTLARKK